MFRAATLCCAAAFACGGGGSSVNLFAGTIHRQSFTLASALSGEGPSAADNSGTAGVILLGNAANLCADLQAGQQPKDSNSFQLVVAVADASGALTAPSAAGVYPLGATSGNTASVDFTATDAACQPIKNLSAAGVSGSVTLTSVAGGNFAGSFDVTFDSGDAMSGSFSATRCAPVDQLMSAGIKATCF